MQENSSPEIYSLEERLPILPQIDGSVNFRDFGGYVSGLFPGAKTRKGFIYRSGYLENITSQGWTKIHLLCISTIIQLTTVEEATSLYPNQIPVFDRLQGLKIMKLPFHQNTFSTKDLLNKYNSQLVNGPSATAQAYFNMLQEGPHIVQTILLQIRNHPDEACIIHCSMGKDRTGVIFAILLSLAGVSHDIIFAEYSMSEEALRPLLPRILEVVKLSTTQGLSDTEAINIAQEAIKSNKDAMSLTFQKVEQHFGSILQYKSWKASIRRHYRSRKRLYRGATSDFMRLLSLSNLASENGNSTWRKMAGKHASLNHLLAQDKYLTVQGVRRKVQNHAANIYGQSLEEAYSHDESFGGLGEDF